MPHPADIVLDANYAGPHAFDAEYFAPGAAVSAGQGAGCRVMRGGQRAGLDMGGLMSRPMIDQDMIRVRRGELAEPKDGGRFRLTATGEIYQVKGAPELLDRARREWTCDTVLLGEG